MFNNKITPWLHGMQKDSDVDFRLFCFSYAGGGASTYLRWRAHISKSTDICAVQPPGREGRISESPISDLKILISNIADVITPHTNIPYAFFGHCNGALISYELFRELRRRGVTLPEHMFISSFRSPERVNINKVLNDLPESEFLSLLRTYGGIPDSILNDKEIIQSLMPTLRADFSLHENYRYTEEEKINCPLTIYGGLKDNIVPRKELVGWRDMTSAGAKIKLFPGGHFFIDSHTKSVVKSINSELQSMHAVAV